MLKIIDRFSSAFADEAFLRIKKVLNFSEFEKILSKLYDYSKGKIDTNMKRTFLLFLLLCLWAEERFINHCILLLII